MISIKRVLIGVFVGLVILNVVFILQDIMLRQEAIGIEEGSMASMLLCGKPLIPMDTPTSNTYMAYIK